MTEIKVGDVVRLLKPITPPTGELPRHTVVGKVDEINPRGFIKVKVSNGVCMFLHNAALEKVEMLDNDGGYKFGDKVCVAASGKVGHIAQTWKCMVRVQFDDFTGMVVHHAYVTRVGNQPEVPEEGSFKEGDNCTVVNARGCQSTKLGDHVVVIGNHGKFSYKVVRVSDGRETCLRDYRLEPYERPNKVQAVFDEAECTWSFYHVAHTSDAPEEDASMGSSKRRDEEARVPATSHDELVTFQVDREGGGYKTVTTERSNLHRYIKWHPTPKTVKFRPYFFNPFKTKEVTVKSFEIKTEHYVNGSPVSGMSTSQKLSVLREAEEQAKYLREFEGNHRVVQDELEKVEKFIKAVNDLFNEE